MTGILVLGVGNPLLSDEGAGIHTLRLLEHRHPSLPGVQYLDGGTLSFSLAETLQTADRLIVLDAADLGAAPGTVRCLMDERMDHFIGAGKHSAHEVGLLDLLDIARLMDALPARRALIGIQPGIIDWGPDLSEPVRQATGHAADLTVELIHQWTKIESCTAG